MNRSARSLIAIAVGSVGLLLAGGARAQTPAGPLAGVYAGGGFSDFTGSAAENLTTLGGTWEVDAAFQLHLPVQLEAGYIGSSHGVNHVLSQFAPGGANMNSNGLQGLVVYDVPFRLIVQPFVFGGVGWDHWNLAGGGAHNPLAIKGSDDTMTIPFGGGLGYTFFQHLDVDARFTYRTTLLDEMLLTNSAGQPNAGTKSMTTWSLSMRAGYLF